MQIKNELLLISCGISQVLRRQRTIQPQDMTSSRLFPLVLDVLEIEMWKSPQIRYSSFFLGFGCPAPADPPSSSNLVISSLAFVHFGESASYKCPPTMGFQSNPGVLPQIPLECRNSSTDPGWEYVLAESGAPLDPGTFQWPLCSPGKSYPLILKLN